ncbi:hypothetical protein [Paenibacillus eucommiae]|uniref:Uncharacterized protein n=1 Tax=Paenibacillus eucommiae TaxID=1355755 RepID=A0ABS4J1T9_9BACL|nr:hypothetical protein [Paenibacillus eucommiae]MBP1993785.1 hypothetical protein [Paenibacillus eucommiae]
MKMAQVGIFLDRKVAEDRWKYGLNVFEGYYSEILSHAGIPFQVLDQKEQIGDSKLDLLIVALEADDEETAAAIWKFAELGGVVISYGGLNKLAKKLNCTIRSSGCAGYADVSELSDIPEGLRYLQAVPWTIDHVGANRSIGLAGLLHQGEPSGKVLGPAKISFSVGKGVIERWAVQLMSTIVGFQQGTMPILKDGIPAPDGTANVDEGILKADDGIELDWELDRVITETGNPYFSLPYADLWREVLISQLLKSAIAKGLTLPFLGAWPKGISHVAMISHDSDLNEDVTAVTTLDVLKQAQIQSTWCMIEPGYSPFIYERVKQEGHELAFHYNAVSMDNGHWGEEEFQRQLNWFKEATGETEAVSNKNHYTRFEGWGELYEWCETHGISSDQTRGPSKMGNVGFLFGTCQPYFPIAWWNQQNRLYDLLEIGFLTQDMDIGCWADTTVIEPFLQQVKRVEGVAHFLFHQVHLHHTKEAHAALLTFVAKAKDSGFTFWTGKQINDWVRARRKVNIKGFDASGEIVLQGLDEAPEVIVWIPVLNNESIPSSEHIEVRYGVKCIKQQAAYPISK